jgi:hypothetical protein
MMSSGIFFRIRYLYWAADSLLDLFPFKKTSVHALDLFLPGYQLLGELLPCFICTFAKSSRQVAQALFIN